MDLQVSGDIAVLIGLLLLPGIGAVLVRDALAETSGRDVKKTMVYAAIYDVIIYCGLLALSFAGLTPYPTDQPFEPLTIAAAAALAVVLGTITGSLWWRKSWQGFAFRHGLSKKGIANTWVDAFQAAEEEESWVLVHLKDGRMLLGVPKYYSSSGKDASVYLTCGAVNHEPVTIYSANQPPIQHKGPGVVITPAAGITLVEFLAGEPPQAKE